MRVINEPTTPALGKRERRLFNLCRAIEQYLDDGGCFYDLQTEAQLAIVDMDIRALNLEPRVEVILRENNLNTVRGIRMEGMLGLFKLPGLGQVGVYQVIEALNKKGIKV